MLNLYRQNSAGADPISADLTDPISMVINPDINPQQEVTLFLTPERATLAANINDTTETIPLNETGRFQNGDHLIVGTEVMRIEDGGGTTTLTVMRGQMGSTPATHLQGDIVWSGYEYTGIEVKFVDLEGTDETTWARLGWAEDDLDEAADGNAITKDHLAYDEVAEMKFRITVPDAQPAHLKTDLQISVTATEAQALIS